MYGKKFTEIKKILVKTILFVSHDVNSIRRFFVTELFGCNTGKVVEYGDTMDVTTNYENFLKKRNQLKQLTAKRP